jgi:hypothetical protein
MIQRQSFPRSSTQPIIINDDAGWCWFQDERAVFHGNRLIIGSVAAGSRVRSRRGNVEVSAMDLETKRVERFVLHKNLEGDDHDAPALLILPDGRILAVYSRHGVDRKVRYRVTRRPGDITEWAPESVYKIQRGKYGTTYSNLYRLEGEAGRIYNFYRGEQFDPNALVSDDNGKSWQYAGRLIEGPGRPYVRYASDNREVVHFITTEQHPVDFDNSLYHGYVRDGRILDSYGKEVGRLGKAPVTHDRLTRVFAGDADNVAWPADADLDEDGRLYVVYSVQKDGAGKRVGRAGFDHRYHYAWFDGKVWRDHEVAFAGGRLYATQDDYTGLICLHPGALNTVYFSANVDPLSGTPLVSRADGERHYEIFKGVTRDGGKTWTITPVTGDSTEDQIRPNVPLNGPPGSALIWLRGHLTTYRRYDLEMVVLTPAP